MTVTEQDRIAYENGELVKAIFKPWIAALKHLPIEEVLADPSLRKRRRRRPKENKC